MSQYPYAFTGTTTGGDNLVVTDGTTTNNDVRNIIVSAGTITVSSGHSVTITTGGGTPGGADTQIQYNDGGALGGIADFTWDDTDLKVGGATPATKLKFRDDDLYIDGSTDGVLALTSDGSIDLNVGAAGAVIKGTTPKVTIGDGGAEDTMLLFDGNAVDFHLALDDTDDSLIIGTGTVAGTNDMVSFIGDGINEDTVVKLSNTADDYHLAIDFDNSTLVLGNGAAVTGNLYGSAINIDAFDQVRIPLATITDKVANTTIDGINNPDYLGQIVTFDGVGLTLTIGHDTDTIPIGSQVVAININASALTIAAGTGQTVNGTTSVTQYKAVTLVQVDTNIWVSIG